MELNKKYTEEELVMLLQQHDQQAFSYLYDNYAPALNGVICRLIPNSMLAEDVLQEVFIKIWNNFPGYDKSKGRLFTWMMNLARNYAIDTLRSKGYKKQVKISGDENSVINVFDAHSSAERFDALGLTKQLSHLKADQRLIIDLAYFHGLTQDEIAREIRIPLGTVKTKMRAAILALRKTFGSI